MNTLSGQTEDNLFNMLNDSHTPREEVYDACHEYMEMWAWSKDHYPRLWARMEPLVFQSWSDDETMWLLKAEVYYQQGWLARGAGYADKVTKDQWRDFRNNLATAETAAKKAWSLNPNDVRIPTFMIKLDEGQSKDRPDMELWFSRAMQLNPYNYDACSYKLHYLYPQWYGSREDMLAFGRECVAATNWGGHVPLILLDAHYEYSMYLSGDDKKNYWMQPDVWPDLKSAFDRFFELNPDEVGWHHNYAWYAYACGQWSEFLHQTTLFSNGTNYDYFGGKKGFDNMLETAKANAH
jgi:hypothetical protein